MSAARNLLEALISFYEVTGRAGGPGGNPDGDPGAGTMLDRALPHLRRAEAAALSPRTLPVSALLAPALAALDTPLAAALREAAALYRWRQNPNYTAASMGAAFMAGYGYVEIAGPKDALFRAADIRAGLLVLGPSVHYPQHAHPAEEVYHPLTVGDWRRGDEDWRRVPAGHAIRHAPMVSHETRAGGQTLLALYCWIGDAITEARLS